MQASNTVLLVKSLEELNHNFLWDGMGIQHDPSSILGIGVVLQSSTVESNLLAHFGNALLIVVSEKIELEDTLGNVRSRHQINLKKLCLKVGLSWKVSLQSLQKESCGLLDTRVLEENLNNTLNRSFGVAGSITDGDHLGKVNSSLRV